eukprot:Nitzschia sp. Nitz4//scaffold173_size47512//28076//29991//NITZ4_007161-RA/size47512-snap-gene-0.5-mRNA-1//1//CDS//3329538811//7634//frame0
MKATNNGWEHVAFDPPKDPNTPSTNANDSSEDDMTVPGLLAEETNDSELNVLEEELESEEQQAEDADEAETEALEAQGFVDGTSPLGSGGGDDGEDEFEPQIEVSNVTSGLATTEPGAPVLGGADVSVLTSNGEVMASASGWGGSKFKPNTSTSTSSNEGSLEDADMADNTTVVEQVDGDDVLSGDNSTDVSLTNVTFTASDSGTAVSNANATEGEWPSVSEPLAGETNDPDLDALEEQLEEEEEEAEEEDEEEDEELEAEGFVMGTDPIENNDDEIEPQIDVNFSDGGAAGNGTDVDGTNHTDTVIRSNTTEAPVDGEGTDDDDDDDDDDGDVNDDDGANEDDDQGVQGKITDDDEEENDDDEVNTDDDGKTTDDDGTVETADDDLQGDDEDPTDDDGGTQGTQIEGKDDDGTATDDDDGAGGSISNNAESTPHPTSASSKTKLYTKAPRPSHSKPSSPPMSLPPQTAQVLTDPPGAPTFAPAASDSCVGFMCSSRGHVLPILGLLALVPLFMIYCWRRYCSAKVDTRGEYRAVAAQYGDVFSDDISDDEADFGDVEDSWGKSGKRTLELSSISQERNGGLSLAEMNG